MSTSSIDSQASPLYINTSRQSPPSRTPASPSSPVNIISLGSSAGVGKKLAKQQTAGRAPTRVGRAISNPSRPRLPQPVNKPTPDPKCEICQTICRPPVCSDLCKTELANRNQLLAAIVDGDQSGILGYQGSWNWSGRVKGRAALACPLSCLVRPELIDGLKGVSVSAQMSLISFAVEKVCDPKCAKGCKGFVAEHDRPDMCQCEHPISSHVYRADPLFKAGGMDAKAVTDVVYQGRVDILQLLRQKCPELTVQWFKNYKFAESNFLHMAVHDGRVAMTEYLINEFDIKVDQKTPSGQTPLLWCFCRGIVSPDCARLLVQQNADPFEIDHISGVSPFSLAVNTAPAFALELLEERGKVHANRLTNLLRKFDFVNILFRLPDDIKNVDRNTVELKELMFSLQVPPAKDCGWDTFSTTRMLEIKRETERQNAFVADQLASPAFADVEQFLSSQHPPVNVTDLKSLKAAIGDFDKKQAVRKADQGDYKKPVAEDYEKEQAGQDTDEEDLFTAGVIMDRLRALAKRCDDKITNVVDLEAVNLVDLLLHYERAELLMTPIMRTLLNGMWSGKVAEADWCCKWCHAWNHDGEAACTSVTRLGSPYNWKKYSLAKEVGGPDFLSYDDWLQAGKGTCDTKRGDLVPHSDPEFSDERRKCCHRQRGLLSEYKPRGLWAQYAFMVGNYLLFMASVFAINMGWPARVADRFRIEHIAGNSTATGGFLIQFDTPRPWVPLCIVVSALTQIYIIKSEWRELRSKKMRYLFDWQNWVDISILLSYLMLLLAVVRRYTVSDEEFFSRPIMALNAFLSIMFSIKTLEFARVPRQTGPLVASTVSMLSDLWRFSLVFFVFFIAFIFAMWPAFQTKEGQTFGSMATTVLLWMLGDWDYSLFDDFEDALARRICQLLFLMYVILCAVLLLNMLIAMMGNTYQEVADDAEGRWIMAWAGRMTVLQANTSDEELEFLRRSFLKMNGVPREHSSDRVTKKTDQEVLREQVMANREHLENIESSVNKLRHMFEKFVEGQSVKEASQNREFRTSILTEKEGADSD